MMEADWEEASDIPLSEPWRAPPTPRGQRTPRAPPRGDRQGNRGGGLRLEGGLAFCFFIRVGGGVLPTCYPISTRAIWRKSSQVPTYLFVHLPASLMFSSILPQRCGAGTWGKVPRGFVTLLPLGLT